MDELYCIACSTAITEVVKDRRKLSSISSQQVVTVLTEVINEVIPDDKCVDPVMLLKSYVCKSCFRYMERTLKLRADALHAFQDACERAKNALPHIPLQDAVHLQQVHGEPSSDEEVVDQPPPKRRRLFPLSTRPITAPTLPSSSKRGSPAVMVTVSYKKTKSYLMTPSRKGICKTIARRSHSALARRCLENSEIRKYILKGVSQLLKREIAVLCSDSIESVLRDKSNDALKSFKWKTLVNELSNHCPSLLTILRHCTKFPNIKSQQEAVIGVIVAILCKNRRASASLFQRIISIVLYGGHASKRVFERLQKLHLCMSHSSTIKMFDCIGKGFDSKVLIWKKAIETKVMPSLQQTEETVTRSSLHALPVDDNSLDDSTQNSITCFDEGHAPLTSTPQRVTLMDAQFPSEFDSDISQCSSSTDQGIKNPSFSLLDSESTTSSLAQNISTATPNLPNENVFTTMTTCTQDPPKLYKIVFDNIDKTVTPRFMRQDAKTQSLHYVQIFSVKSRIDYSSLSTIPKIVSQNEINLYDILPTETDYKLLKQNFSTLVARTLVEYMPFFKEDYKGLIPQHIPHQYSRNMSTKSEVVPLGVLPKSEISHADMIDILEHIQSYVPCISEKKVLSVYNAEGDTEEIDYTDYQFMTTLVGGDQLSTARARGSQRIRSNSDDNFAKLSGLFPVIEDWHAKVCFLEVIGKRLYKTTSSMDRGTLHQLRNILNRRNVSTNIKGSVNAFEDFMDVITKGHILTAAMEYLGMSSLDVLPDPNIIDHNIWMEDDKNRKLKLTEVAEQIIEKFIDLTPDFSTPKDSIKGTAYAYACETLGLSLLLQEFKDGIREGDGNRVMRVYKYLFLVFKSAGRTNYAKEAFTLLVQYHFLLPPQLAEQLKWSRFVNNHGICGKNISLDLQMEHLNRICQTSIEGLGANKSETAIIRVGKTVGVMDDLLKNFDSENDITPVSDGHSVRTLEKDLNTVIKELQEVKAFKHKPDRIHKSFKNIYPNLIRTLDETKVKEWMTEHFAQLL